MNNKEMKDGQRVQVRLYGDEDWYTGVVIKARKQWVQIENWPHDSRGFIADECNIVEWRPAEEGSANV
jgi:hypothetical protein